MRPVLKTVAISRRGIEMPKGIGHTNHPLPRASDIVDAGIQRFKTLYPDMAKRIIIPMELNTCIETAVYRAMERLSDEITDERTTESK